MYLSITPSPNPRHGSQMLPGRRDPTWLQPEASNSSSWCIKSRPRPLRACPPSPFCGLTCLIDRALSLFALSPCHLNNVHLQDTNFGGLWSADRTMQRYGEKKEALEERVSFSPFKFEITGRQNFGENIKLNCNIWSHLENSLLCYLSQKIKCMSIHFMLYVCVMCISLQRFWQLFISVISSP